MGVVYKAEDTKLKRIVALKFLTSALLASEAEKTRFVHEARAAAALNHPNICTIYEIDEAKGQSFIAMEFIEGQSLKEKIESGPLKLDEALNIAIEAAEGLQAAHEKGIVHRDMKPANVMITLKGQAKVMDFGLAKLTGLSRLTKTGMTMGTVAYMSPEQAQGIHADHRSDIWSFGVMLYEMITGQLPFKGEYEQAVVYSILNEDAEPITGLRTGVPMELERIVNKAMAKRPDERYQHVDEMLVDLKQVRKEAETGKLKVRPAKAKLHPRERVVRYGRWADLILLLALAGLFLWQKIGERTSTRSDSRPRIRLAVLPFDNITRNPEDEYFADGMTDEMISKLSKISGCGVIARTSVMHYKIKPKTVAEIGQELRVSKILEGSVRKAVDKLRIAVKQIDVKTQEPVWSTEYDKEFADVFAIQSEVAQQVASALRVELSPSEKRQIEKRGTENLEAYNLYLQGHYYAGKVTLPGLNKGLELFNKAIELDPKFAPAFAGLARCYYNLGHHGYLAPIEVFPEGKAAVLRALAIDPTFAEAHSVLAHILLMFDWDWPAAEKAFKHAIELSPDEARTHFFYAIFLYSMGRFDEALSENKRSQMLNPLDIASRNQEGIILYFARAGKIAEAQKVLDRLLLASQQRYVPPSLIALIYSELDEKDKAFEWIEKAYEARDTHIIRVKAFPAIDNLRSDPRFATLLKKMGLEK